MITPSTKTAAVIGSGPVGAFTAIMLAREGWRVEVRHHRRSQEHTVAGTLASPKIDTDRFSHALILLLQVYERSLLPNSRPRPDDTRAYTLSLTYRGLQALNLAGIYLDALAAPHAGKLSKHVILNALLLLFMLACMTDNSSAARVFKDFCVVPGHKAKMSQ